MTPERWQQIDRLFQETLACPPSERADFLARSCDGDEPLRNEIESLLSFHDESRSFIESPAEDIAAELLGTHRSRFEQGQIIDNYKIVGQLGSGGMGEVYLADDTRLNRKIALKLLPSSYTNDADRVRRFEHEAQAASALNHPNIVTIHEIGQTDSLHFIATEFVDGKTLREHMTNARMTVGAVLDVAAQIASALEAAHQAGIIHRDIKPENVMLRRDGFVKVLDFGLAKLIERKDETETTAEETPRAPMSSRQSVSRSHTSPGVVMGTVTYMSPEQARGAEVDAGTDVWSLGVVLYEMVAGQAPFEGETHSHVIVSILERAQPPLSLGVEVPPELERIISKALLKEKRERYQTAGEMKRDLKRLGEDLTVEYRLKEFRRSDDPINKNRDDLVSSSGAKSKGRTTGPEHIVNGIQRHKGGAVFVSVTAFLLIASVLYFSNLNNTGSEAVDSVAVLPFLNAGGDPETEYLAEGISDSLVNNLSRLPNLKVISLSSASRFRKQPMEPEAVKALGREYNVKSVLISKLTLRGDDLAISTELVDVRDNRLLWGQQYNTKLSNILVVQREIAEQISGGLRLRLSGDEKKQITKQYTENPNAYRAYLWGRSLHQKRTPSMAQKSIEYFDEAIRLDPNFALAYATLADAQISLAKLGEAMPDKVLLKAKEAVAKALEIDDKLAEAHATLGSIRLLEWDWAGAERAFNRANELNPNYQRDHSDYEHYLRGMKRFDEAVQVSKRALELEPVSAFHNRSVAMALYFARRYDEAIDQCQKALELDPNMPTTYRWLARSYEQKKLYDQAIAAYLKTGECTEHGPEAVATLRAVYDASGWEGFWQKLIELKKERAKQRNVQLSSFAEAYARLQKKDEALAWLEKAYEQRHLMMTTISRDPLWDFLRSDPRYTNLIKRMGLEP